MALDSFSTFLRGHSVALSPAEIERELSSMWKPASSSSGAENTAVSRVVLGNVVCISTSDHSDRLKAVVQKVVPIYPCRLFLLEYEEGLADDEVHAAVNAQCFVPKKDELPVCCEVIHLTFGPNAAKHLHGCVIPLLIADLQTVLWTSLGDVALKQIAQLRPYSDRAIRQASLSSKPSILFRQMITSTDPEFDLSWFRTRPVREQMAAFFDDPANDFNLSTVRRVQISAFTNGDGGSLPEVVAAIIVGWLAAKLRWKASAAQSDCFRFESSSGPVDVSLSTLLHEDSAAENTLNTLTMTDGDGRILEVSTERGEGGKAMTIRCGRGDSMTSVRNLCLSEYDEADAVGIALNSPSKVKYFREAAAHAAPLLEHFKK